MGVFVGVKETDLCTFILGWWGMDNCGEIQ